MTGSSSTRTRPVTSWRAASGSGAAGIVATARSLLVEIGAAADEVKSALTSLEQAGQDIRDGIQASDSCSQLRDRDFASG